MRLDHLLSKEHWPAFAGPGPGLSPFVGHRVLRVEHRLVGTGPGPAHEYSRFAVWKVAGEGMVPDTLLGPEGSAVTPSGVVSVLSSRPAGLTASCGGVGWSGPLPRANHQLVLWATW